MAPHSLLLFVVPSAFARLTSYDFKAGCTIVTLLEVPYTSEHAKR